MDNERIRNIRRASRRILSDYSTDTLAGEGNFSLGGNTGNIEWATDWQRLQYLQRNAEDASSMIEIFKTADKFLKGDAPLSVQAEIIYVYERIARFLGYGHGEDAGTREEVFRRRNELEKDNYFRSCFVCTYLNAEIYPRFTVPLMEQARKDGRLPADDKSDAFEDALEPFFEGLNQDYNALFETLAKEYGEEHIRQRDERLADDYLSQELREAVKKTTEERTQAMQEERKQKRAERREIWRERLQAEGDTPAC